MTSDLGTASSEGAARPRQTSRPHGARTHADAAVRARCAHVRVWAAVTAGLQLATVALVWLSFRPPAGDPVPAMAAGSLSGMTRFLADAAAVVTLVVAATVLDLLRRRALAHEPPPARGEASVNRLHRVPVLNLAGPVTVLAETGVRGPGRWWWFAACGAVALAAGLRFGQEPSAAADVRSGIAAAVAALLLAAAAQALRAGLGRRDGRAIALPGTPGDVADRPFWSRGLVDPQPPRAPRRIVVEPPLEDFVDDLIIPAGDSGRTAPHHQEPR